MDKLYKMHGGIPGFGILVSHSWMEIGAILYTIYTEKVDFVVELGAHRGGLGAFLIAHSLFQPEFKYLGVELDEEIIEPAFRQAVEDTGNELLIDNEFDTGTMCYIKTEMELAGRTLIYCDGGNKPFEFLCYGTMLKCGDLIMVHDYKREFKDKDFADTALLRMTPDYLKGCRQVLFMRPQIEPDILVESVSDGMGMETIKNG